MVSFASASPLGSTIETNEISDGVVTFGKLHPSVVKEIAENALNVNVLDVKTSSGINALDDYAESYEDSDGLRDTVDGSTTATYDSTNKIYHNSVASNTAVITQDQSDNYVDVKSTVRQAQSFITVTGQTTIAGVQLKLLKNGTTADIVVKIGTTENGDDIGSKTLLNADIPDNGTVDIEFDSVLSVSEETTYYLTLTSDAGATFPYVYVNNTSVYSDGQLYTNGAAVPARDMHFIIYSVMETIGSNKIIVHNIDMTENPGQVFLVLLDRNNKRVTSSNVTFDLTDGVTTITDQAINDLIDVSFASTPTVLTVNLSEDEELEGHSIVLLGVNNA